MKHGKKVILKNCAPFTNCMSEINNTQINDTRDIDIIMPMYNSIEYNGTSGTSRTSRSLWKYYRDEPALDNNNITIDFSANDSNSILFNFKQQVTGQTGNVGTKHVEVIVPLKYLSNFWKTLEMPLINCEI